MGRKLKEIYIVSISRNRFIFTSSNDILDIVPTDSYMILEDENNKPKNFYDYYNNKLKKIRLYHIIRHDGLAYLEGIIEENYNKFIEFKEKRDKIVKK